MALNVVMAGGGTGGHIFPALALAEAIRKREPSDQVRFVGTEGARRVSMFARRAIP